MDALRIVSLLCFCISAIGLALAGSGTDENRLMTALLSNYSESGKWARPVQNQANAVDLKIGFNLVTVNGLEPKDQTMSIYGWLKLAWNDCKLRWKPTQHGGVTKLMIPADRIWLPDLVNFNEVAPTDLYTGRQVHVLVNYTGDVLYVPRVATTFSCRMEKLPPYTRGIRECHFKIGSWTYTEEEVNLSLGVNPADSRYFFEGKVWNLTSFTAERHSKIYHCCPDSYPYALFKVGVDVNAWY